MRPGWATGVMPAPEVLLGQLAVLQWASNLLRVQRTGFRGESLKSSVLAARRVALTHPRLARLHDFIHSRHTW
jgi:hypothetical protein